MKIDLTGSYFVENINYLRQKYALSRSALARLVGIKAFVAAVFGGIGSIPGAMIGGIL